MNGVFPILFPHIYLKYRMKRFKFLFLIFFKSFAHLDYVIAGSNTASLGSSL